MQVLITAPTPLSPGDWTPRGRRYAQRALRAERGGMHVLTTTRPLPTGTRSAPSAPRWALAACAGMRCSPRRVRPMQVIPNLDCH
jgi:hypothetical protein